MTAKGFSVNGNNTFKRFMQAGHPGYETALGGLHIQTGKQDPQLIMAWRSVPERQKAARNSSFLSP